MQEAPSLPHAPSALPDWHAPLPSQQPFGHDAGLQTQTPLAHSCPAPQATHGFPSLPQLLASGGLTQVTPLQHPVVQSDEAQ
jgi:hypothetical protein